MINFFCFMGVFIVFILIKTFVLIEFLTLYLASFIYVIYKKLSVKGNSIDMFKHMKNVFYEWLEDYKDIRTFKYIYKNGFKAWLSSLPMDIIYELAMNSSTPLQRHIWKIENMFIL